jgi:Spore coat polysaccharide biosynthesis protein F, CMP-KDO synthetase homolog
LLISKGGNLNILNDDGQTPLAFGSETMLNLLGLKEGVATFTTNTKSEYLPKGLDNNKLLSKLNYSEASEAIDFSYNQLAVPTTEIIQSSNKVQSYLDPSERKKVKWTSNTTQEEQ